MVTKKDVEALLEMYGFGTAFSEQREYIDHDREEGKNYIKIVFSVLTECGKRVVIKLRHEQEDILEDRARTERQSEFSQFLRQNGILTPRGYMAKGRFCSEYIFNGLACNVTVEDWCGEEIREINEDISYKIGRLMARMHLISLEKRYELGCGTLFSAAYLNDVDAYEDFCRICEDERLDRSAVERIRALREEKLAALRAVWGRLPRAAVQGDVSINNLVLKDDELAIFDFNNAGDEILVSDLVMEGLLTAYEMDLPEGADPRLRERFFPALLEGYLSLRRLSPEEADAAWVIYTMYHSLWFSRIVYNENSLEKTVERGDFPSANRLLAQILADLTEEDDGRFRK